MIDNKFLPSLMLILSSYSDHSCYISVTRSNTMQLEITVLVNIEAIDKIYLYHITEKGTTGTLFTYIWIER